MSEDRERTQRLIERCKSLGFAAWGVCAAEPSRWTKEFESWIEAGKHGSMTWLAEHADVRCDVRLMLADAASVLMVADQYAVRGQGEESQGRVRLGRVARYARGRDYHVVLKKRLHTLCDELSKAYPGERFRAFVDTAPVLERELAARCGIGWTGKHTLTIHPRLGSYVLLGGVVMTLKLEAPAEQRVVADHCGTCTRCIDACPTQAITPYAVDARRCVSYLTIEHRGLIEEEFFEGIGDWVFGCDVCQEVCPHNSERAGTAGERAGSVYPAYEARVSGFDLLEVLGWEQDERREACSGSAIKRAKLDMMRRNAAIAAGNELARREDATLRARIEEIARDDASELVRETALRVLRRSGKRL